MNKDVAEARKIAEELGNRLFNQDICCVSQNNFEDIVEDAFASALANREKQVREEIGKVWVLEEEVEWKSKSRRLLGLFKDRNSAIEWYESGVGGRKSKRSKFLSGLQKGKDFCESRFEDDDVFFNIRLYSEAIRKPEREE